MRDPLPMEGPPGGLERRGPEPAQMRSLRALARLLDASMSVPGTRWRFGLDALIGLVPGVGDVAGAVVSGYVLLQGAQLGASRWTLLRMAGNVAVEALLGTIPLVGDLFDAAWKSNLRNVRLLEEHLARPERTERASRGWVLALVLGLVALVLGLGALAVWLLVSLVRMV